jgi:ubiquinone/menaquinone biosynthesis C-methylase UbiE/DNA-binding HxlR family transcriptional regulator
VLATGPEHVIEALRAAGEPTRLRILGLLAREELSVMELCRILDQSQPRVSRHLKLMADAGLVERFPEGPRVFYRLGHDPAHRALTDKILSLSGGSDDRDARQLEQVRRVRESEALAYFERVAPQWDQLRSLYLGHAEVEAAILEAAGDGPFRRLVDLGTGSGRMLALLGPRSKSAVGLDLSQNMLSMARLNTAASGVTQVELRHGDIFETGLPARSADLVIVHQVLHYLSDPGAALRESARLVTEGGRLLVIDFAEHDQARLRELHQHRWLGFTDRMVAAWMRKTELRAGEKRSVRAEDSGLTVKIWCFERPAE